MEELNEQERLQQELNLLKQKLKELMFKQALGKLEDDRLIKETRDAIMKTQTSLELNKISNERKKSK